MLIARCSADQRHPFRFRKTSGVVHLGDWCRVNEVTGFVRLTPAELAHLPPPGRVFTHFNLQHTSFVPGMYYAGLKILKNGYYSPDSEVLPSLRLDHWVKLKCLRTRNLVPYSQVSKRDLKNSDLPAKTVAGLQSTVWRKYHKSLPKLTKSEFLAAGLCITTFKVTNLNPSCNLPLSPPSL